MHVQVKPLNQYPWYIRPFFWNQKRKYGAVLDPGRLWGRSPKLFASVAIMYGVLDRKGSPLRPVLRSLVTVRVSQVNDCHFCVDINSATLAQRSGSMDKMLALSDWHNQDLFSEEERVVLEYTEVVTYTHGVVSAELMTRLRGFYDDEGIVELTGLIAFQNLSSKFNNALDVPAQGFCPVSDSQD